MKKLIITILCLFSYSVAFASESRHFQMRSLENVVIDLSYEIKTEEFPSCMKCSLYTEAQSLKIKIIHPDLKSTDKIRVVLLNFKTRSWGNRMETYSYDLEYSSVGTFSVQINPLAIYSTGYPGTDYYRQEMAIVINGQWLKSAPQSSNFNFNLYY